MSKTRDQIVDEAIERLEELRNSSEEYLIVISIDKGESIQNIHSVDMSEENVVNTLIALGRKMKKQFLIAAVVA